MTISFRQKLFYKPSFPVRHNTNIPRKPFQNPCCATITLILSQFSSYCNPFLKYKSIACCFFFGAIPVHFFLLTSFNIRSKNCPHPHVCEHTAKWHCQMYAQQSKIFNNHSNRPEHHHNSHIRPYDHNKNHRHLHTHNFLLGMNVFLFLLWRCKAQYSLPASFNESHPGSIHLCSSQ